MQPLVLLLGFVLGATSSAPPSAAIVPPPDPAAQALYDKAVANLQRPAYERHQQALRDLEEAARLEPANDTFALALAQAYFASGYERAARLGFERLVRRSPGEAAPHLGLGLWWRHAWRVSRDPHALDRAVDELMSAAWLAPYDADAWLLLVPLYLEQGRSDEAASAAFAALQADPRRLEAHLAVAATISHLGLVQVADSVFRATVPELPAPLRARFESAAALVAPEGAAPEASDTQGNTAAARLEAWSALTESVVLSPGAGGAGGAGLAPSDGGLLADTNLGIRLELFGRLLALRPELPVSQSREAEPITTASLGGMFTQVAAALNGR